jgi:ATP-dependent Clp protease ATP-binding subunit ClpB
VGAEAAKDKVLGALRGHFRPEFLNRVDEIIVFHNLSREDLVKIVDIQLVHLRGLLSERKLDLKLTAAGVNFLANVGYDPNFGARPLKRAIQRYLQDPLAMAILQGEFKEGDVILVDVEGDKLIFKQDIPVVEGEVVNAPV